jgi:hypothetical protein
VAGPAAPAGRGGTGGEWWGQGDALACAHPRAVVARPEVAQGGRLTNSGDAAHGGSGGGVSRRRTGPEEGRVGGGMRRGRWCSARLRTRRLVAEECRWPWSLAMAAMAVARSGDGSDQGNGAEGTAWVGECDITPDWGTRSAEAGERQQPWSLAAAPMAAPL